MTATANTPSSLDADTYRNANTGARIWRRELLSRRRDEFADLPDGIRSIYVARVARSLAGLTLALGGALIVALSASPELSAWLQGIAPGPRPAVVTSLLGITWGLGALFYLAGWALAENRFTRAMLRAVKPTEDLHRDVQRLANVRPGDVAIRMTRAWETASAALPALAVATLLPATLVYLAMAWAEGGFVKLATYETALSQGSLWLAGTAGLGIVAALIIQRMRSANSAALHARRYTLWATLVISSLALISGLAAGAWLTTAIAGSIAIVAALGTWAAGRIRKDRMVIDSHAPEAHAAPSLRSALRKTRAAVQNARTMVRERGLVSALGTGFGNVRARLAVGRRLMSLVKAPLSWSAGTYASVFAGAAIVAFTGWLGAGALAQTDASEVTFTAAQMVSPDSNDVQTPPLVDPANDPDPQPFRTVPPVLYTAPAPAPGVAGKLLILDLHAKRYASIDLDLDLQYLPCGKIRPDAEWIAGSIERTDGQLYLDEDYAPGEPAALDITSAGKSAPMELRDGDGIVFTPCTLAPGLDMNALDQLR